MSLPATELHDFVKLLLEQQTALRAYIVSMMPGSDDAEDVLQNTNVVVWEKMAEFTPGTEFRAWLFAIARNMVKAQFRANKRHHLPSVDEELMLAIDEVWAQRPTQDVTRKQRALDRCLEQLRPLEKNLISVRYAKGNNLENYAKQIGRPADSLRTTLSRVRGKLRLCVDKRLTMEGVTS